LGVARTLDQQLAQALRDGDRSLVRLREAGPENEGDGLRSLLRIYDLHLAPVGSSLGAEQWQNHPIVAELKWRLEHQFLETLNQLDLNQNWKLPADPEEGIRALAAKDRVPAVYRWLSDHAEPQQVALFLALEGGPDGGFDDLVAICQVGLEGEAKLEMARNYWDEMGRGVIGNIHTELHRRLSMAMHLRAVARIDLPVSALRRAALGPLLATNRWLQPEMIGALGLIELQAGPRCRKVITALNRISAPDDALPFYEEHARADPLHGKHWLSNVVGTLKERGPGFGERMTQGARWRWVVNSHFLRDAATAVMAVDGGWGNAWPSPQTQVQPALEETGRFVA